MKKIFIAAILFVFSFNFCKAQFVPLPDASFRSWLISHGYSSCVNGTNLDTTVSLVLTTHSLNLVGNYNIVSLSGIEYFRNLDTLIFYNCGSDLAYMHLLKFPPHLKYLICSGDRIDSLGPLPSSLLHLDCAFNYINNFPALPPNLTYFAYNDMNVSFVNGSRAVTVVPPLPSTLTYLDMSETAATVITSLPPGLVRLICKGCVFLTTLPASLPITLKTLDARTCKITSLPTLPPNLNILDIGSQVVPIASLPALPNSLKSLNCRGNIITVLPQIPDSVSSLYFQNNLVSNISALPASLEAFDCSFNNLTSLPEITSDNLLYFACNNNQLTTLPAVPPTLTELICYNNYLTELPALPLIMNWLDVHNNAPLHCLPPISFVSSFYGLAGTGITCLPNVIQHNGGPLPVDTMQLCDLTNPNGCAVNWNIAGKISLDSDNSCSTLNQLDPPVSGIKVLLFDNGNNLIQQVYNNSLGQYSFDAPVGTYTVKMDTTGIPFDVLCPLSGYYTSVITLADSMDLGDDFRLVCKTGYDLSIISVTEEDQTFFPGENVKIKILAGDNAMNYGVGCGTGGLSGTVSLKIIGPATYFSSPSGALTPSSVTSDSITWNVPDFSQINFDSAFVVILRTDTTAVDGDWVGLNGYIIGDSGSDYYPINNLKMSMFPVYNSFDPNVKEVYPPHIHGNDDWINYTIRFQNTGTGPAHNIKILDTLDLQLDINSFEQIALSHEGVVQLFNNSNIVRYTFPNILLPDSGSNEEASHGYIQFRIKLKSMVTPPATVLNHASVYFDYNDPIITNDIQVDYCNSPQYNYLDFTICEGEQVEIGNSIYNHSGSYINIFTGSNGCDSTVSTNLNVEIINAQISSFNNTLTATGNGTIQWMNCTSGNIINGETGTTFTATVSGNYAAILSNGNCKDTTACEQVTITGLNSTKKEELRIYPNPVADKLLVTCYSASENEIVIKDLIGRALSSQAVNDKQTYIDVSNLSSGVYYLHVVYNDGYCDVKKFVKQ